MRISHVYAKMGLLGVIFSVPLATAAENASVSGFSPSGTVKGVRQVRANFSEAMVPFGDPRGQIEPFDIDCPMKGNARWADQKNWILDFDQDLPAGVRCKFTVKPTVHTLAGHELTGQKSFAFSTGGPAITNTRPWNGSQIREDQVFVLTLDTKADEASVLAHSSLQVEGVHEPFPFKIISGAMRDAILNAEIGNYRRWHRSAHFRLRKRRSFSGLERGSERASVVGNDSSGSSWRSSERTSSRSENSTTRLGAARSHFSDTR